MRDSIQGDSHNFLILFAQVVNKFYLKKLGSYTYCVILAISQLTILMIVMSQFYASLQLTTLLSKYISKMATFLTLSANNPKTNINYFTFIKTTISLLNFQAIIGLIAFLQATKSKIICNKYIQNYFYFVFSSIIFLSLPIIYFSIYQLTNVSFSSTAYGNILDAFNLISSMVFIYAVETFAIGVECKYSQSSTLRIYQYHNGSLKIIKIAISYAFVVFQVNTRAQWFFLLTILLIFHLIELKNIFRCRKYMNDILQRISELITLIWLTCLFVMALAIYISAPIILDNLGSISLSIFILSHCSSKIYLNYKRKYALIAGENALKNEDAAISYALELIYSLYPEKHDQSSVKSLYKALSIQSHRTKCQNIECICQNRLFIENKQKLMRKLTEELLQQICRKFPYSFCLRFINIGFRISHSSKVININQQISQFLKRKNVKNLTFEEEYIVIQTLQIIKHRFKEYNRIQNHIKCQNIFIEESMKTDTKLLLQSLINTIIQKNKLLLLQIYNLNAVEIFSIKINELICQMQQIWTKICEINSFNHQLYRLFIFYYQNVIPSQIQGKQITRQIIGKLDKLKHLKGFSKDVINKYIYSRKSCVIQSNLEQSFGVITNVSRYCQEVLGWRREQLINTHINDIMPEYFAKSHQESMQSWLQNCTVSHYNTDVTEFGYVDTNQTCFQGFLLMKILPSQANLLYYSVIIRQNDNDYLLLNSRMQIQGIGKRLVKEDVFTSQHIKHSMTEYTDFNFKKKLQHNTKTRRKIFLKNIHSNQNIENMTDSCIQSSRNIDKRRFKYDCTVLISKHTISKDAYYLIKFENVTKWVSSSEEFIKQLRFGSGKFQEDDNRTVITMKYIDDELIAADDYESVEPVANNVRFTQLLSLSVRNSSISSNGNSDAAFYNHFIKNVKKKLINPSLIPLIFFKKISVIFLILFTLLVVDFFSLRKLFVVGFGSFNDAMFGDGAVSDNNQILEIMYNDVMMSKVYCQIELSSPRCEYMINSTISINNILYNLYLDNIKVYLQNRTALSGLKYYASYGIVVPFLMANTTQQISTLQFMEYYYAAVKKQLDQIIAGRGSSKQGQDAMTILLKNWQTMKFINHNAIYFYLDAGEKELRMLMNYLLILGGGLFICIVALGIGLKRYQDQFIAKKIEILSIHSYINSQLLRDLTDYYIYLKQIVIDIKFIPQQFEKTILQGHQEVRKDMKYNQGKVFLIQIIIVILVITILGGIQILKISLVLPSSLKMVNVINNLMDSENYLLQAYFQLKTYYLTYDFNKSVDQISKEISLQINQTETRFVQVAKDSLNLFSTDPDFTDDFNILLTADVCQLTEWVFEPWQVQHCLNNFTTPVLSLGLVSSMIFFQRKAFQALNELHRRQYQNINKTQYFIKDVFKDIDDSIFYMFRLYQATQARMYEGLNYSVNNSLFLLDFINVSSTIILISILFCWFTSFRNKQRQMSQLYGIILQLPEGIMKPQIIAKIKSHLEIEL